MQPKSKSIFQNLRETARPYDHLFIFSLSFMFLSGIANILPSWLIKVSIDGISALGSNSTKFSIIPKQAEEYLLKHYPNGLEISFLNFKHIFSASGLSKALYLSTGDFINLLPIAIVVVFTIDAIFKLSYIFSIRSWGLRIVQDLRDKFHLHLNQMALKDQEKYDSGSLVSVVSSDLQSLQSWLSETMTNLFNDGFKALFLFGWLLFINFKLTMLTLVTIPLFALPVIKIGKKIRKYSKSGQDYVGQISSFINETLVNQRIIKAFNLENWRQNKFAQESKILYKLQSNWFLFMSIVSPITNIVAALGISIILYFGLRSVGQHDISIGEFSSFFVTSILLYDPIKRLGRVSTILQSALGVSERVYKILDEPIQEDCKQLQDSSEPRTESLSALPLAASVEFKNVVFEYEARSAESSSVTQSETNTQAQISHRSRIFNNLNLYIAAKTSLAIVGPSGSGKTTLVSLIPRFYEINAGEIFVDSHSIRDLSLHQLRRYIALVNQDPLLFTGTLRENLEIVLPKHLSKEAKDESLNLALDKAYLREFINELPDGIDSNIGERGQKLSLGQRQRVSLARAFLSKAPIVILDEPTSALDNKSQQFVYSSIQELMKERTVIIIAHRLDTIQSCNKIIYMENGEILESGNYDELLAGSNKFASLVKSEKVEKG
ncbi:MAG: ABC transporter ATP-binding protein/permease [Cyanobacteria bacterium REEB446]|nr:ABC transporter ATP-binding protein/permease [Cyanobacteria bacterium REEB446]